MRDKPFLSVAIASGVLFSSLALAVGSLASPARSAEPPVSDSSESAKLYEAQTLLAGGRLDGAEALITAELAKLPQDPNWLTLLAEVRLRQRRTDEALKLLDEANHLGGDNVSRAMLLSLAESAAGRLDLAEPAIRKAIQLDPSNATSHYFLARLLYTLNRFDESIDESNKALALQPANVRAYENEGLCYEGKHDPAQAEIWYRKAIEHQQSSGNQSEWPILDLATMLIHENRYAEAKPLLVEALAINPDNAQSLLQMGILLERSGDLQGALTDFRAAIQRDPSMGGAYYHAGRVCRKLGYTDEAEKDFKTFRGLPAKP